MGVYERTISFELPSGWGRVAAIEMCWPIGRPRIAVGEGRLNR
jgi:hypothetical protein